MSLNIIVADDHPVVLLGARAAIEQAAIGRIVALATTPGELMAALAAHPCDVLVTDFSMPDAASADGFPMLARIRRSYPELPIVLLSAVTNLAILRAVAGAGVLALVDKSAVLEDLPNAITAAHRGQPFVSHTHEARAATAGQARMRHKRATPLSPREAEVLRQMALGLTVSQVAERARRSITTISRQKRDAMRKLGLFSDAELFDYLRTH